MALNPRKIKDKSVEVDRELGEATIKITLYARGRNDLRTSLTTSDVIPYAIQNGAEVIGIVEGDSISNQGGEITGTWVFKVPTTEPENSTTTVLKRRKRNQEDKKTKVLTEEDWNVGPEE